MAHNALITKLVDTAIGEIAHALDAIPGETDPFKVETAFIGVKCLIGRLESLVAAIHDHRFSPILTGATHAQDQDPAEGRPHDPQDHEAPQGGPAEGRPQDGRGPQDHEARRLT